MPNRNAVTSREEFFRQLGSGSARTADLCLRMNWPDGRREEETPFELYVGNNGETLWISDYGTPVCARAIAKAGDTRSPLYWLVVQGGAGQAELLTQAIERFVNANPAQTKLRSLLLFQILYWGSKDSMDPDQQEGTTCWMDTLKKALKEAQNAPHARLLALYEKRRRVFLEDVPSRAIIADLESVGRWACLESSAA